MNAIDNHAHTWITKPDGQYCSRCHMPKVAHEKPLIAIVDPDALRALEDPMAPPNLLPPWFEYLARLYDQDEDRRKKGRAWRS